MDGHHGRRAALPLHHARHHALVLQQHACAVGTGQEPAAAAAVGARGGKVHEGAGCGGRQQVS